MNKPDRARKFIGTTLQEVDEAGLARSFSTWRLMLERCFIPGGPRQDSYLDRGITVCERWFLFSNFLADMGVRPEGLSLDRIDNDGDYEPDNCRWATAKEQARNTRRNRFVDGKYQVDAAREAGISEGTITRRRNAGYSDKDLLDNDKIKKVKLNRVQVAAIKALLSSGTSRLDVAKQFGISRQMVGAIDRGDYWRNV